MNVSGKNMNCEEYKEAIAADPSTSSDDVNAHVVTCESCAAFQAEMQALDSRIAAALAINTPDLKTPDLQPIEDDNVVNMPFERKSKTPFWLAMLQVLRSRRSLEFSLQATGPLAIFRWLTKSWRTSIMSLARFG